MRKLISRLSPLGLFVVGLFLLLFAAARPASAGDLPLRVFVSVLPLKTFVEKIGGTHVDVRAMVRPGYNPHTYEPTPHQIVALTKTTLYVRTGIPFEHAWMERIRSVNPAMQVLDARSGLELRDMGNHRHESAAEHDGHGPGTAHEEAGSLDPHVWTSPPLVKQMARTIRDKLAEIDPVHRQDYARNFDAFALEIDALDRELRALLDDLPNRKLMVFHPAWGYFADTYGLTQVPIEKDGKEPGARALVALIEQAKREGVKVIFVQPQFDRKSAVQVGRAIGGRILAIDPLSADYADNLRNVARQIAAAGRQ